MSLNKYVELIIAQLSLFNEDLALSREEALDGLIAVWGKKIEESQIPELKRLVLEAMEPNTEPRKVVRIEDCLPWAENALVRSGSERLDAYIKKLYRGRKTSQAQRIKSDVIEILDGCGDPEISTPFLHKGLVVGKVQSGKTGNFAGVINAAFDVGYNGVIVFSGLTNKLRDQTRDRLKSDVVDIVDNVTYNYNDITIGSYRDFLGYFQGQRTLLVLKKNISVLNAVILLLNSDDFIQNYSEKRILIIDDECDNASINSFSTEEIRQYKIAEELHFSESDESLVTFENLYRAINIRIKGILSSLKFCSYIGYTATPYNVIASSWDDLSAVLRISDQLELAIGNLTLFPDHFIFRLETPLNYVGVEDYFLNEGRYSILVSNVDDFEEDDDLTEILNGEDDILHNGLINAYYAYLFALINRKHRGIIRHGSMMIHVDRRVEVIDKIAYWINRSINKLLSDLHDEALRTSILAEVNERYTQWKRISTIVNMGYDLLEIIEFESLFKELNKLSVISMHSKKDSNLRHHTHALNYITPVTEENRMNYVIVGGDMLSRGYTVEGLLVTYFLRLATRADTLYQMARWCGYRDYEEDLVRIYTSANVIRFNQGLIELDNHLDKQFVDNLLNEDRISPREWGLRLFSTRNEYQVGNRRLEVTDPNKLRLVVQKIVSGGGSYLLNRLSDNFESYSIVNVLTDLKKILSNENLIRIENSVKTRPHLYRADKLGAEIVLEFCAKYLIIEGGREFITNSVSSISGGNLDILVHVNVNSRREVIPVDIFSDGESYQYLERNYSEESFCTKLLDRDNERLSGLFDDDGLAEHLLIEDVRIKRAKERERRSELNRSILALYVCENSNLTSRIRHFVLGYLILAGNEEVVYERN